MAAQVVRPPHRLLMSAPTGRLQPPPRAVLRWTRLRHPLVIPTVLYIAGVLLGDRVPLPLSWLFGASFALLLASLVWGRGRKGLLAVLLVAAGWTNQVCQTAVLAPDDLRRLPAEPALVTVRGRLAENPEQRILDRDEREAWRTLAVLEVTELRRAGEGWRSATGRVAATTPGVLAANYFAGQPVEVSGVLNVPAAPSVPGQFDYAAHLQRQGVARQLRAYGTNDWRLGGGAGEPLQAPATARFTEWARRTLALGLPTEDEPLRLLWAMNLGWRTALTDQVSAPFMQSGTMHIFAISGLHIALIAGILVALLRVLRVSRGWCGLLVIPLLWFYTAATGWQASAIRAALMMSVVIAGWSLRRPWDLLNSLAAAALIILLVDPSQLFLAGFQLSFAVVASLALFTSPFERLTRKWVDPDPLQAAEVRPWWQRATLQAGYYLAANFSVSLAACVGSLPLIAYYFNLVTPTSLLANLVVVPLSGFALMGSLGALLTGWAWPGLAGLFNHAAWLFMSLMIWLSETFAALPGAWFRVPAPTGLELLTYYAVVVVVLAGWLRRPRVRGWLAAGLLLLVGTCVGQHLLAARVTRVTVIGLGGGHVVHAHGPGKGVDVLVDCGGERSFDPTLAPYLTWAGENWLPRLALTHGDARQIGAAELVFRQFAPREVFVSPIRFRSPGYRAFLENPELTVGRLRTVQAGDALGAWQVLHPRGNDNFPRADDAAMVLRGDLAGVRVLLLNDLGRPGQEALLHRTPPDALRADIVVAGLPVEGEPLSDGLLDAIQPRLIIVADNEQPATRRATATLLERLTGRGVPVLSTREGAVLLEFQAGGWTARRADGRTLAAAPAE